MQSERQTTILAIDDERSIREGFRSYLEDYDYDVLTAENGRIGLKVFQEEKPDLVLLDLRMPELDGLEVLKRMKQMEPDIPVIVVSGTGEMTDAVEALRLGAWDFLSKPVRDLSVLLHTIRKGVQQFRLVYENKAHRKHLEEEVLHRTEEIKKTSEALRESEESLTITLDSIADAVIAADSHHLVSRMNPAAERMTGWSLKEAKGVPLDYVFPANPMSGQPASLMSGLATNLEKLPANLLLTGRDGSERCVAVNGSAIRNKAGDKLGIVLVCRDITQQVKLEERLQQFRKMDAIGQLASGVSHDFNNILSGIIGAADMLDLKLKENKKLLKYARMIRDAGVRGAELTQKLLDFSRQKKNVSYPKDMQRMIMDIIPTLKEAIDKRIVIKTNFRALKRIVICDLSRIENAILNLGINAAEAMPESGLITISTANVNLPAGYCETTAASIEPGTYIEISIMDTGTGMEDNVLEHIFDPYFTTRKRNIGTGLGLASVYNTVMAHKGDIRVFSQSQKGTVVKIYLPVPDSTVVNTEIIDNEVVITGSGCILVVDDEEVMRTIAFEMLKELGYTVLLARDGNTAVGMFKQKHQHIDLVLLDLMMPRMNGRETLEAMRKIQPDLKVLLTSGFSSAALFDDTEQADMPAFIQKPFGPGQLSREIHRLLIG